MTETVAVEVPGTVSNTPTSANPAVQTAEVRTEDHIIARLYGHATELEKELERAMRAGHALTASEVGKFQQLVSDARSLLPGSVALKEGVTDIDMETLARDAWHMLHVEVVPTLHNALPQTDYEKTG